MEQIPPTNFLNEILGQDTSFSSKVDFFLPDSPNSEIFLDHEEDEDYSFEKLPGATKAIQKVLKNKKKYDNISNDLREKLIEAVEVKGEKIKHAAKRLQINYSSAKSICQIYKREGRSSKKIFKRRCTREEPVSHIGTLTNDPIYNMLNTKVSSFTSQGSEAMEAYETDTTPPKDPLMSMRDRLLDSRAKSAALNEQGYFNVQTNKELTKSFDYSSLTPTQVTNSNISSEIDQSEQFDQTPVQNNQQTMNQPTLPQTYMMNGFMPRYYIQGRSFQAIPQAGSMPVIFANQQQSMPMVMNNPNMVFAQNAILMNQKQTMNFDSPQTNNHNIQNINENKLNQPNQANPLNGSSNCQMNQFPIYAMPQQGMTMNNQIAGLQLRQPVLYLLPQGGNMPLSYHPQLYGNNNLMYGSTALPNLIQTQSPMMHYGGNYVQNVTQDLKQKV